VDKEVKANVTDPESSIMKTHIELIFGQIKDGAYVYFNHSYYCQAGDPSDVIAEVDYGIRYACAVRRENVFGVQFHPEKSQAVGLRILKNFVEA